MKQVNFPNPCSFKQALTTANKFLTSCHIETPMLDARILLAFVTDKTIEEIIKNYDNNLTDALVTQYNNVLSERVKGKPVSKIMGKKYFWKHEFKTNINVLDPRNDTETLVEHVLSLFDKEDKINMLELGVGSGCIITSLLYEFKNSNALGVDINDKALETTLENAKSLKVKDRIKLIKSDWFNELGNEKFDLIVSNPPYIRSSDIPHLSKEVREYDPLNALDGGESGLDCYKKIANKAKNFLTENSYIIFEIGHDQDQDIIDIMIKENFELASYMDDLNGIKRSLAFKIK